MSTHAAIIVKVGENEYKGVYCHYDGYVAHTGHTLVTHYATQELAEELVSLGYLSSLGQRANPIGKHSFDKPEKGTTVAYHRDGGEGLQIDIGTYDEVVDILSSCDYIYVFANGKWCCNGTPLMNLICQE